MSYDRQYPAGERPPDLPGEPWTGSEAEAEIRRMGMTGGALQHALFRGHIVSLDFRHRHFPPTTSPFIYWSASNKFLRDQFVPEGWEPKEEEGVAKVVAPDGSFAITATAGNEDTGLVHRIPTTRRPRGSAGARDIFDNRQGDLFGATRAAPTTKTWYLLSCKIRTHDAHFMRAELSLPWAVDEHGNVVQWFRRLILPNVDLNEGPPQSRTNHDPAPDQEIDVFVQRRGA